MKYLKSKIIYGLAILFMCLMITPISAQQGKGKAKGKAKKELAKQNKLDKKATKELRKAEKAELKAEIEAIKEDASLNEDQQEEAIKNKRNASKEAAKAERDEMKAGKQSKKADATARKEEMKTKREALKAERKFIEEDESLSEDEKGKKMKELNNRAKADRKMNAKAGIAKATKRQDATRKQLGQAQSKLAELKADGKISEEDYAKRMEKVEEIQTKLSKLDEKIKKGKAKIK